MKPNNKHKSHFYEYISGHQYLDQLWQEYPWIVEQLYKNNYPKMIALVLAELYYHWTKNEAIKAFATKEVRYIFNLAEKFNYKTDKEILSFVEPLIKKSNKKRRDLICYIWGKPLTYLLKKVPYAVQQMSSMELSSLVVENLSELYKDLERLSPFYEKNTKKFAQKHLKIVLKKINNKDEAESLSIIKSYLSHFEKKRVTKRIEDIRLSRLSATNWNIYRRINTQKIIKDDLEKWDKFISDVDYYYELFLNSNWIEKYRYDDIFLSDEAEESASKLSQLSRILFGIVDDYDLYHFSPEIKPKIDYDYWKKLGYQVGEIYILNNNYMPGIVKIGKTILEPEDRARSLSQENIDLKKLTEELSIQTYIPEILAKALSRNTGVPYYFNVVYSRETVLDYPIGKKKYCIEKLIHNELEYEIQESNNKYLEYDNKNLRNCEFFAVPSIKYAIRFVEEILDRFDRLLYDSQK